MRPFHCNTHQTKGENDSTVRREGSLTLVKSSTRFLQYQPVHTSVEFISELCLSVEEVDLDFQSRSGRFSAPFCGRLVF